MIPYLMSQLRYLFDNMRIKRFRDDAEVVRAADAHIRFELCHCEGVMREEVDIVAEYYVFLCGAIING